METGQQNSPATRVTTKTIISFLFFNSSPSIRSWQIPRSEMTGSHVNPIEALKLQKITNQWKSSSLLKLSTLKLITQALVKNHLPRFQRTLSWNNTSEQIGQHLLSQTETRAFHLFNVGSFVINRYYQNQPLNCVLRLFFDWNTSGDPRPKKIVKDRIENRSSDENI